MNEQSTIQHGVLLSIYETGVLLTGPSNIGKSELALALIERGHRLIADDYISLQKENNSIIGSCPPALQGFLAIRDLGIINISKIFGQQAISSHITIKLIIELALLREQQITPDKTYLQGSSNMQTLMNINIPQQTLLVKPNRNLATLVEISVRIQQLKKTGYNAYTDFLAKQTDSSL